MIGRFLSRKTIWKFIYYYYSLLLLLFSLQVNGLWKIPRSPFLLYRIACVWLLAVSFCVTDRHTQVLQYRLAGSPWKNPRDRPSVIYRIFRSFFSRTNRQAEYGCYYRDYFFRTTNYFFWTVPVLGKIVTNPL